MEQELDLSGVDIPVLLQAAFNKYDSEAGDFNDLIDRLEDEAEKCATLELKVMQLETELAAKPQTSLEFSEDTKRVINDLEFDLTCALQERENAYLLSKRNKEKNIELEKENHRLKAELREAKQVKAQTKAKLEESRQEAAEHAFKHGLAMGERAKLREQLDIIEVERDELLSAVNKHDAKMGKVQKDLTNARDRLNQQDQELKELRKLDAKALKKKVDNLKKRNGELFDSREQLIKDNRAYRADHSKYEAMAETVLAYQQINQDLEFKYDMAKCSTIYSKDGEHLLLLPNPVRVAVDDVELEHFQVQLLYTNSTGIWRQVTLDNKLNLAMGSIVNTKYAESTVDRANKCLPQMSEEVQAWSTDWLRKVADQDWQVEADDLYKFTDEQEKQRNEQTH